MSEKNDFFSSIKDKLLEFDPVAWSQKYLTLDGKPYRVQGNGYKPISDLLRLIGIKSLEKNSKQIVISKSRQIGLTTTTAVLEMYFMGAGLFGRDGKPPIRIIHAFPTLEIAASYSKTKFSAMVGSSIPLPGADPKKANKSYMQSLLDTSSDFNNSMTFKQFKGGNHIFIESVGADGDRLRGKQLCLETELPTPNGFVKLKDLKTGDQLFDESGNICKITKLHPINKSPESYRLTFDDNSTVDACADHLWLTYTKANRISAHRMKNPSRPAVKNTAEIYKTLKIYNKGVSESNHSVPNCAPLKYSDKDLPIDPYLLGLWLGDGNSSGGVIESADPEILNNYEHHIVKSTLNKSKSCGYRIKGLTTLLNKNNLIKNKHIPEIYLRGSFEQRLSLLQGLMDTDGCIDNGSRAEFCSVIPDLAKGVHELILSLGIKCKLNKNESWLYDNRCQDRFRINFIARLPVFRLPRKLAKIRKNNKAIFMSTHRYIVDCVKIDSKPMRCITVDSPSHLFLITRSFIPTHNTADIIFYDECQDMPDVAISNTTKILTKAQYGAIGAGVQVYFGTPKMRGSAFYQMWQSSSQQYYHLGCEKCKDYFPLYTPGTDDWEKIWIKGFIVKCGKCGHEQDKRDAAERGRWVSTKDPEKCDMIGFHINQLFIPEFTKERMLAEKPGISPVNSERAYQNEVLGEFYQGDTSPITNDEIRIHCAEVGRKFRAKIEPGEENMVVLGIDYGGRNDLEQLVNPNKVKQAGKSFTTAVVMSVKGPNLLSIDYACKFKQNDMEYKKGLIDQIMRTYSVNLAVGDIGYSEDFSNVLHQSYGDRYIVSRASGNKIIDNIKFNETSFPKEINFARDHFIMDMYEQLKKGQIKFPYGDYEKIAWLVQHCCNMEIKPTLSRSGDPQIHYIKSGPNDGFMAMLNAYLAYKFLITKGFSVKNPNAIQQNILQKEKIPVILGRVKRRF